MNGRVSQREKEAALQSGAKTKFTLFALSSGLPESTTKKESSLK